ncbi:hypothetical protein LCGC14_1124010 [marine sediment metagenome]|uniref:Uncharacterized protein n=1 Tax=marine sediment metagenome TaxID=412755 RepID=A0A0F9M7Y3_9ZZZZ
MNQNQVQTVPQFLLEKKLGKKLGKDETFTTKTGTWKVIEIGVETYTLELVYAATTS